MELFYGKFGSNNIFKPKGKIVNSQNWVNKYLFNTGDIIGQYISDANLEIFNEMILKNDPKLLTYLSEDVKVTVQQFISLEQSKI